MNKRQARQAALRETVKDGKINRRDGSISTCREQGSYMFRSLAFGYKLGRLLGLPVSKGR